MRFNSSKNTFTRRTILLGMVGSVAEFTGCGGGTDVAGLTSGGTGSFTSGTITGLGSIIVNGIRYNNDNAQVTSLDDGSSFGKELKAGMVVYIEGSPVLAATTSGGTATATAYRIVCGSEWQGPVSNINVTASSFDILGLTVDVVDSTVFEGVDTVTQLSELSDTHYVEVHGEVIPSTGHLQASHIEVSTTSPAFFKLSGVVRNRDADLQTFSLGSATQLSDPINWSASTSTPARWSNGDLVRVTMTASLTPSLTATRIRLLTSPFAQLGSDNEEGAVIQGLISSF